jgi:hypothetical protein
MGGGTQGVGKLLLGCLLGALKGMGVAQVVAMLAGSKDDDPAAHGVHEGFGFKQVLHFESGTRRP